MSWTPFEGESCRRVKDWLNFHSNRNPLAGMPPVLVEHCASCGGCAQEIEVRKALLGQLRKAVREIPVPPSLEARVRRLVGPSQSP